ncbi:TPA: GNAT family N-acetyltransferase [Vibrio vulnificus]|nr:GNAT family N-acetyltransferase [Vibrio vulnificus]HAS8443924.1 GNAT family N-acetyltransferase [Vibrio vulnificus]HDY7895678.1 GNAT family N-acetyltransferase [Vibrio vulnificus]HDY7897136.1 GNAT family N-acetyltransferase [Vibrio vulnificus]
MDLKTEFTFDLQNEEFETIRQGIRAYNAQHLPDGEVKKIGCFVRNKEGNLVGGLTGDLFTNSVFVEFLWLDEHYRQHGLGSQLMQCLEHEVKPQGVTDICLDTYSFQALDFYLKLGFEQVGQYSDYPAKGINKYFLQKVI